MGHTTYFKCIIAAVRRHLPTIASMPQHKLERKRGSTSRPRSNDPHVMPNRRRCVRENAHQRRRYLELILLAACRGLKRIRRMAGVNRIFLKETFYIRLKNPRYEDVCSEGLADTTVRENGSGICLFYAISSTEGYSAPRRTLSRQAGIGNIELTRIVLTLPSYAR